MIACPLCKATVAVPALDDLLASREIEGLEASILGAVWSGKGRAVNTEKLFDAMYADDPDGGPSPTRMYLSFNRALARLNNLLDGSGVSIVAVGFRQGYRLELHP
ncbi:MAG: hypothetical protein E5V37_00775 [Mesorhizobium sp.]|uniref:hypothetical protein n=1 Tax=Mesorhizobium sp. M2A.F.Ca.ET.029.05.1.1 TaxID=2496658 RepID=UPI000FD54BF5|nr:hypothetical protein [Mesorhizobium sp. M2A.F.Ca.ET.029.05.1.1]RVD11639.1 hypothetical protein EN753_01600 [Mesorhizobium sp. M2A.F.Ca.ET.029.05.1.1]TIW83438.1 MAG: hypothetical protein E5V52_10885 [Mesorhizobium sp.]TIX34116.1 MAG: hypothetical protein E5V37_00775 [Mesorhizobium sp.]